MEILEKGILSNGTDIQIEDWSKDFSFYSYGSTLGTYPKSKQTLEGSFSPNLNESFRFALEFSNYAEAKEAFEKLISGKKKLADYKDNFKGNKEYLKCV